MTASLHAKLLPPLAGHATYWAAGWVVLLAAGLGLVIWLWGRGR